MTFQLKRAPPQDLWNLTKLYRILIYIKPHPCAKGRLSCSNITISWGTKPEVPRKSAITGTRTIKLGNNLYDYKSMLINVN